MAVEAAKAGIVEATKTSVRSWSRRCSPTEIERTYKPPRQFRVFFLFIFIVPFWPTSKMPARTAYTKIVLWGIKKFEICEWLRCTVFCPTTLADTYLTIAILDATIFGTIKKNVQKHVWCASSHKMCRLLGLFWPSFLFRFIYFFFFFFVRLCVFIYSVPRPTDNNKKI